MKPVLFALMLAVPLAPLLGLPLAGMAQGPAFSPPSAETQGDDTDFGQMLDDQLGSFFDGIIRDIGPKMEDIGKDLGARLSTLGPVFDDLSSMVDDIKNYQTPERLANGDILIRRKPGAPPPPALSEPFAKPATPDLPGTPGRPEITPAPTPPVPRVDPSQPEINL